MALNARTAKGKGKEVTHSSPLSVYSAPGGLRQAPGRAVESPAEARTCGKRGFATYVCFLPTCGALMIDVIVAGGGPTGLMLAGGGPTGLMLASEWLRSAAGIPLAGHSIGSVSACRRLNCAAAR